jgi:hypothetical protein
MAGGEKLKTERTHCGENRMINAPSKSVNSVVKNFIHYKAI